MSLDFESIYGWFGGTIYPNRDCGVEVCGVSACCYPHHDRGQSSYIFYLPGELEFLKRKLGTKFPAKEQMPSSGQYHCFGKQNCVYDFRPIDCRSYPYWPVVSEGNVLGFLDVRKPRCPIMRIPFWFLQQMLESWNRLMQDYSLLEWFEHEAQKPQGVLIPYATIQGGNRL